MSMKALEITAQSISYEDEDEGWIEDEIQKELSNIDSEEVDDDQETEYEDPTKNSENEFDEMETIPSMEQYLAYIQKQTKDLENELQECDEVLQEAEIVSSRDLHTDSYLEEIAKEQGVDINTLKQQILEDISKEEEKDNCYIQGIVDDIDIAMETEESTEQPPPSDQEHVEIKQDISGDIQSQTRTTDELTDANVAVGMTESEQSNEEDKEKVNENDSISGCDVIAEITETDLLEKAMWRKLKTIDDKYKEREHLRNQERALLQEVEEKQEAMIDEKRKEKQEEIEQEQKKIKQKQQEEEAKLLIEAEEQKKKMKLSLEAHKREIEKLSAETAKEKEQLLAIQRQQEKELLERRNRAAITIQRHYRGYGVRKQYGKEVTARIKEFRQKREKQRIAEIEKARQAAAEEEERQRQEERAHKEKEAEMKRLKEEEDRKRAEEEKRKQEEERRKKEEQLRIEEERKQEEEKKRLEEERRKREKEEKEKQEEELRKLEEERRKCEELKKKKLEEQQKRLEEEQAEQREAEKKKREQEEKKREEIERRRREAEKVRLEEEKRQKEEEERQKRLEQEMLEKAIKEQARLNQLEDETKQSNNQKDREGSPSRIEVTNSVTTNCQSPARISVPIPPKHSDDRLPNVRRSRQSATPLSKSRAFLSTLQTPQAWGESLPKELDTKRVSWIKDCLAWSKVLGEQRTRRLPVNKKPPRRPLSGKMLPLLDKSYLLSAANVSALQKVTTVELHDLPGCSLRTLAECPQLKTLVMQNCHLVTTDGIQMCKSLQFANLKHNQIEVIMCKDLSQLTYLDLSNNTLTSIHGLEGCHKLKYLNLAHNRITRIGGMEHLQSLHTLDISHNQLITCKGLSAVATIQRLDVSHNHLNSVEDLDKLALLQVLAATGNTLLQIPNFYNHVLLHTLLLGENNISDISALSDLWLPMLHTFRIHQNRLTGLPNLTNLILLQELDISNNQILDMERAIPGLVSLRRLKHLLAEGNPITEESDWRSVAEDRLSRLERLDDLQLTPSLPALTMTRYEKMCSDQLQQHLQLEEAYRTAVGSVTDLSSKCDIHAKYYAQSYNLATEQRYSHEYGEISATASVSFDFATVKPAFLPNHSTATSTANTKVSRSETIRSSADVERGGQRSTLATTNPDVGRSTNRSRSRDSDKFDSMLMDAEPKAAQPPKTDVREMKRHSQSETVSMKSKFEAMLSGALDGSKSASGENATSGSADRSLDQPPAKRSEANMIRERTNVPANTVGEALKQEGFIVFSSREHSAATKIQALWRGYFLRKRLQYALTYARQQQEDDDDSEMEFAEVDLNDFSFNEDDLEKSWLPPEMPELPNVHPVIRHPPEGMVSDKQPQPPSNPRHVWKGVTTPPGGNHAQDEHQFVGGRPPLPPVSHLSEHASDTLTEGAHTYRSKQSKKEERITEEWGFKDSRTAELMLQRAKKLKYNALKRKKLGQLDPKQRLALFKKLQETTRIRPVVPIKKGTQRQEYFQAREEEERIEEADKFVEKQVKQARTYEWIHTQVGHFDVTSSRIQNCDSDKGVQTTQNSGARRRPALGSDGNLPRIDPNVLAGGRALLTGSPMSVELQSVDSRSQVSDMDRSRRLSLPRPDSASEHFPPIKTGSAPSTRPEKMSWRRPEVNKSIGWGGGKKRGSLNH